MLKPNSQNIIGRNIIGYLKKLKRLGVIGGTCKHTLIEIVSPDEVNSTVRCVICKEIIGDSSIVNFLNSGKVNRRFNFGRIRE